MVDELIPVLLSVCVMTSQLIILAGLVGLVAMAASTPLGRVVGGVDAIEGQFPHQISLRNEGRHTCGGSILSRNFILTAAHCIGSFNSEGEFVVNNASSYTIRAGSINRLKGGMVIQVVKITHHVEYGPDFFNDVAVLELQTPLIYSENIKPIQIATSAVPAGSPVIISGWGLLRTNGYDTPIIMQWNTLKSISKSDCQEQINMGSDTLICLAHDPKNGACNGDSGGPATYNGQLVGVAGFVVDGCGSANPDGYANVYYHRDWIKQHSDL